LSKSVNKKPSTNPDFVGVCRMKNKKKGEKGKEKKTKIKLEKWVKHAM